MPRNRGSRGKKDGTGRFIEVAACYGSFRLPAAIGGRSPELSGLGGCGGSGVEEERC